MHGNVRIRGPEAPPPACVGADFGSARRVRLVPGLFAAGRHWRHDSYVTSRVGPVYEARYGRTPKHFVGIGGGLVMSAVILLIPAPAWAKVIVVGGFGGNAVMLAAITFSRNPALRVDATGVTIRPYPLRFSVIAFYPWEDVVKILVNRFKQPMGRYVQIQLREGAAWLALGRATATRPRSRKALIFAENSVAVNGWTLHPARLTAAVARFAPAVQVIDAATGSVVNPERHDVPDDTGQFPRRQVPLAHRWPRWVLAGAGAGLVAGVILAVVNGPAHSAASTAAGFLILLALAAVCVAAPATFYRRYRSRHGAPGPPSSPDTSGAAAHVPPEDWS
jgi:hypothetical protein